MAQTRLRFHSIETGVCGARIHQGVSQSQSNNEEERRCAAWSLEGGLGDGDKANKVNRMKKHTRHGTSHAQQVLWKCLRFDSFYVMKVNTLSFINLPVHPPPQLMMDQWTLILAFYSAKSPSFFMLYTPAPNLRPSQSCTCC